MAPALLTQFISVCSSSPPVACLGRRRFHRRFNQLLLGNNLKVHKPISGKHGLPEHVETKQEKS